jgi:hypothetical protein
MNKTKEGLSTTQHNIRSILKGSKHGLKAYEICDTYLIQFKRQYESSTMTARMREMGDVTCNLSTYRYSLEGK